ncbi:hypothetical protein [Spirosoma luteolum]|jgi:hypothetical protein
MKKAFMLITGGSLFVSAYLHIHRQNEYLAAQPVSETVPAESQPTLRKVPADVASNLAFRLAPLY